MTSILIIVTGASKGFGRSICLSLAKHLLSPQTFLLFGRSNEDLLSLSTEINLLREEQGLITICKTIISHLNTSNGLKDTLEYISQEDLTSYTKILFFSNAGTLEPLGYIGSSFDIDIISNSIQLNITSPCVLISEFIKKLQESGTQARTTIINTSSLWAIEPAVSFAWYSTAKSAVDMFMSVAAEENKRNPNLRFLNYAPGPLDTDMQKTIREDTRIDSSIQSMCLSMRDRGQLVSPDVSALKCIRLVIEEAYRSGDHIDFYDQIEGIDTERQTITTCCANPNCQCGVGCTCRQNGAQCGACHSFLLGNRLK